MKPSDRRFFMPLAVVAILLFSAIFNVTAQQRRANCPVVKLSCPDTVYVGEKLTFTADVQGGDKNVTPTYNWTVSASLIESGQGTATIEVNTSDVTSDTTVTATVDVGGFDRECSTSASCTASIMKKAEPRKFDEYGKLMSKDEAARLDNFVIELSMDPTAEGYIISYGGRASRAGDAQKAADKQKDYMVKQRGVDGNRVTTVNGGFREQPTIELWVVPSGAEPPKAMPTIKPNDAKPATPKTGKGKKS
jgi:hypothetical protein